MCESLVFTQTFHKTRKYTGYDTADVAKLLVVKTADNHVILSCSKDKFIAFTLVTNFVTT